MCGDPHLCGRWLLNSCFIPGAFIRGGQAHPGTQLVLAENGLLCLELHRGRVVCRRGSVGCRMLLGYQLVGLSRVVALLGAKLSVSMCFPSALGR